MDIPFFTQLMLFALGFFVGGLVGILIGAELMSRAKAANPEPGDPLPHPHTIGRLDLP